MSKSVIYTCNDCGRNYANSPGYNGICANSVKRINDAGESVRAACGGREFTESEYTPDARALRRCEFLKEAITANNFDGCGPALVWFNFSARLALDASPASAAAIMADIEAAGQREAAWSAANLALGGRAIDPASAFARRPHVRAAVKACKAILKAAAPAKVSRTRKVAAIAPSAPVPAPVAAPVGPAAPVRPLVAGDTLAAFWVDTGTDCPAAWEFAANNPEVQIVTDAGYLLAIIPAPAAVKPGRKVRRRAGVLVVPSVLEQQLTGARVEFVPVTPQVPAPWSPHGRNS